MPEAMSFKRIKRWWKGYVLWLFAMEWNIILRNFVL